MVGAIGNLAGLSVERFICEFENLGENCEFGLVQRACGAEPLGLFRFGAPGLKSLTRTLQTQFEAFGTVENLEFSLAGGVHREYSITEKSSGMSYHTWQYEGQVDESTLLAKQASRLGFLVRKFIEDLADGQKILVWKSTQGQALVSDVQQLREALDFYGQNPLVWVVREDEDHPSGAVRQLGPRLWQGYIKGFSTRQNIPEADLLPWLDVCSNTYRLIRDGRAAAALLAVRAPAARLPQAAFTVPTMAHIQNYGDTLSGPDGWVGVRGSGLAVEGFVILPDPAMPERGMSYQAVLANGSLSEVAEIGAFRGTRGKNQPVRGLIVHMDTELSRLLDIFYEASFIDGSHIGPVAAGMPCRSGASSALEAFKITLAPKT